MCILCYFKLPSPSKNDPWFDNEVFAIIAQYNRPNKVQRSLSYKDISEAND